MSTAPAKQQPNPSVTELEREALKKRGTANQVQRYEAGLLPEAELLAIARAEVFAPFAEFRQWHNRDMRPPAVRHKYRSCHGHIKFETAAADELQHDQWETLAAVKAAAEIARDHHWVVRSHTLMAAHMSILPSNLNSIIVEPLAHWGTCEKCKAEEVRHSAKVAILWAGRSLVREYTL